MPVYLIRAGEDGPVKIGKADDPARRLVELQVAHYQALRLVRVWEGGDAEEATLHLKFADLRLRGEWFSFSRAMLGDVGLVEISLNEKPAVIAADAVIVSMDVLRAQRGLCAKVARELGISTAAIAHWEQVPAERLPDVERASGIPRHLLRPDICPAPVVVAGQDDAA